VNPHFFDLPHVTWCLWESKTFVLCITVYSLIKPFNLLASFGLSAEYAHLHNTTLCIFFTYNFWILPHVTWCLRECETFPIRITVTSLIKPLHHFGTFWCLWWINTFTLKLRYTYFLTYIFQPTSRHVVLVRMKNILATYNCYRSYKTALPFLRLLASQWNKINT
jgi:hypothetical protein